MRILITGAKGKLGSRLQHVLSSDHQVLGIDLDQVDISHFGSIHGECRVFRPEIIINAAAYTAVDRCEDEPEAAYRGNAVAVRNLATIAAEMGIRFIHFSTDFVFDGNRHGPAYMEYDATNPISVYGKSKLAGEHEALSLCSSAVVLRLAWLYGAGGWNFTDWAVESARKGEKIKVVTDQIGSPTWVGDVVMQVVHLLKEPVRGLYHCTAGGFCSRYEWACEAIRLAGLDPKHVVPICSDDFVQKAPRPRYSVLDNFLLRTQGLDIMRDWKEALKDHLDGR